MKVGDTIPVQLQDWTVAEAVIESIDNGEATLLIPATRVVMGVKQSLTDLEREPEVDRVFVGKEEPVVEVPPHNEQQSPPSNSTYVAPDDVGAGLRNADLDSSILD